MTDDADTPKQIGGYRVLELLGEGGMGMVWLAEQQVPIHRRVAIKLIRAGLDTKQVLARFEAERQALAILDHPGIAKVLDAGATEAGRPWFAMEYVPGLPLTEYCDRRRLGLQQRLELMCEVAAAVQHAHQKGIIHRDLKPSNVLVREVDGRPVPKIIDFGVAKALDQRLTERTLFTEQGLLVGTPEYMSPEQADPTALGVDTRTDVYSLGVMLYELMTGQLPFDPRRLRRAGLAELQRTIREDDPPKPSTRFDAEAKTRAEIAGRRGADPGTWARRLRGEVDWITMRCLEKDPGRRYSAASELAAELRRFLAGEPIEAGAPGAWYRLRRSLRRHRVPVAVVGSVVAALAVGLVVALLQYGRAEDALVVSRAAERAAREATRVADENAARAEAARKELAASAAALEKSSNEVRALWLFSESKRLLATDTDLALLLAIEGAHLRLGLASQAALWEVVRVARTQLYWPLSPYPPYWVRGLPDGKVACLLSDGMFEVWDVRVRERVIRRDLASFMSWRQSTGLPVGSRHDRGRIFYGDPWADGRDLVDWWDRLPYSFLPGAGAHLVALETGVFCIDAQGFRHLAVGGKSALLPVVFVGRGSRGRESQVAIIDGDGAFSIKGFPDLSLDGAGATSVVSGRGVVFAQHNVMLVSSGVDVDGGLVLQFVEPGPVEGFAGKIPAMLTVSPDSGLVYASRPQQFEIFHVDAQRRLVRRLQSLEGEAEPVWAAGGRLWHVDRRGHLRLWHSDSGADVPVESGATLAIRRLVPCDNGADIVALEDGGHAWLFSVSAKNALIGVARDGGRFVKTALLERDRSRITFVGDNGVVEHHALEERDDFVCRCAWIALDAEGVAYFVRRDLSGVEKLVDSFIGAPVRDTVMMRFVPVSSSEQETPIITQPRWPRSIWNPEVGARLLTAMGRQRCGVWQGLENGWLALDGGSLLSDASDSRDPQRTLLLGGLFDVGSGAEVCRLNLDPADRVGAMPRSHGVSTRAPGGSTWLAAYREGVVEITSPNRGAAGVVGTVAVLGSIARSVAVAASGLVAVVDGDGKARSFSRRGEEWSEAKVALDLVPLHAIRVPPKSGFAIAVTEEWQIQVCSDDLATRHWTDPRKDDPILTLDMDDEGLYVAIGYRSGLIRVLTLATGTERLALDLGRAARPLGLAFSVGADRLGIAASDAKSRVVDLTTGEITHEFTHDDSIPTECGFSEDGRELVVHSTKSWHFWPLNLMEEAQKLKRRELTPEERATYGIPLR